ncbi:MAG: hypothetical protein KDK99_07905 [Verrucomicrobiales bacterium]|nr:hypothetical protein [Verrucomicrobiales bacterium]
MKESEYVSPDKLMEHLRASHTNVQDVIKFVDTKTGALTGLVTLLSTLPFFIIRYFTGEEFDITKWENPFPNYPYFPMAGLSLLTLSFTGGLVSICCSLMSLTARPPSRWIKPKTSHSDQFCILFPFYTPKQAEHAHEYFSKIVTGFTQNELLAEYVYQVEQLGSIVERKVRWHRRAAIGFYVQLVLPLVVVFPYHTARYTWLLLVSLSGWIGRAWAAFRTSPASSKTNTKPKSASNRRARK